MNRREFIVASPWRGVHGACVAGRSLRRRKDTGGSPGVRTLRKAVMIGWSRGHAA